MALLSCWWRSHRHLDESQKVGRGIRSGDQGHCKRGTICSSKMGFTQLLAVVSQPLRLRENLGLLIGRNLADASVDVPLRARLLHHARRAAGVGQGLFIADSPGDR